MALRQKYTVLAPSVAAWAKCGSVTSPPRVSTPSSTWRPLRLTSLVASPWRASSVATARPAGPLPNTTCSSSPTADHRPVRLGGGQEPVDEHALEEGDHERSGDPEQRPLVF